MDWTEITKTAKDFGITAVMLFAVCWAVKCVVIWVGQQLIIPIRDKLIARLERFFDRTETTMDVLTDNVKTVSLHMTQQTQTLERIERRGCASRDADVQNDTRIRPGAPTLGTLPQQ